MKVLEIKTVKRNNNLMGKITIKSGMQHFSSSHKLIDKRSTKENKHETHFLIRSTRNKFQHFFSFIQIYDDEINLVGIDPGNSINTGTCRRASLLVFKINFVSNRARDLQIVLAVFPPATTDLRENACFTVLFLRLFLFSATNVYKRQL
jgi:hypothetical protein